MQTTHRATQSTRREFLGAVGRGVLVATIGSEAAVQLGLADTLENDRDESLTFGALEPLVCLMQETPADKLLPLLTARIDNGTDLKTLVMAGALANARTFGGEDYVGFHTMMALSPALHMADALPAAERALPVFKVLYRNTSRIQERGGRKDEVLHPVTGTSIPPQTERGEFLRDAVRRKDAATAEAIFATLARSSDNSGLDDLLYAVQDNPDVHRVVLPYRAWDLAGLVGQERAYLFLRQSVRYCVRAEGYGNQAPWNEIRTVLPQVLDEFKLLGRTPGTKSVDDAWVEKMSETLFTSTPQQAARAAGSALAEGIAPASLGEAISLTANQLVLRDLGRSAREEIKGKPMGSVHGDSIGVHACDSANAWRNLAKVSNARNCFASLILGAYQVANDRTSRGGDFANWQPLPLENHVTSIKLTKAEDLLREIDEAVRFSLQARVSALVHRYGQLGHSPRPVFDLMLRYAISEDGALHAEKFFRTSCEEFASTRTVYKWRYLTALARVTASEFGRPAPGMAEARTLLKLA